MSAILAALSLHPSASAPTRHIRFVASKSQSAFQPRGDRAVKGHHSSFSASLLTAFGDRLRLFFRDVRQRVAKSF